MLTQNSESEIRLPESMRMNTASGLASPWRKNFILEDNVPIVAIVTAYLLAVFAVLAVFGIQDKVQLVFYYGWFTRVTIVFSGMFILLHIRRKSYRTYLDVRSLAGLLTIFLLSPLFNSIFVSYKQAIPSIHPFSLDARLMQLDYALHFGRHPWELLQGLLKHSAVISVIDSLYMAWFIFLLLSCLWMAWTKRRPLRRRFFISALLIWILLGSGLATVFSSAGPCYYSRVVQTGSDPFAPLMTRLGDIHKTNSLWAVDNQTELWQAYREGRWLPFGGISAMPSIHLAIATLYMLLAFNIRKWLGLVFCGYLLVMQIGSVILGWHYAVDGYAGTILALAIWHIVMRVDVIGTTSGESSAD